MVLPPLLGSNTYGCYEDLEELEDYEDLKELEDAQVRSTLRGSQGNSSSSAKPVAAISADHLRGALRRAHDAVKLEHQAATEAWRGPLSLFKSCRLGSRCRADCLQIGHSITCRNAQELADWAVEAVHTAQRLVKEAARLGDRTDLYVAQINLAEHEELGIHKGLVLEHMERLDRLAQRLHAHLEPLRLARDALDAHVEGSPAVMEPPSLPLAAACAAAHAVEEAARRGGAPALSYAPEAIRSVSEDAGVDILMFSQSLEAEDEDDETHQLIISERPKQHRSTTLLQDHVQRGWRSVKNSSKVSLVRLLESAAELNIDSVLGGIAASAVPYQISARSVRADNVESPRRSWEDVRGVPAESLDLADPVGERQAAAAQAERIRPILGDGAHSRWERCRRRTDRRWTLP